MGERHRPQMVFAAAGQHQQTAGGGRPTVGVHGAVHQPVGVNPEPHRARVESGGAQRRSSIVLRGQCAHLLGGHQPSAIASGHRRRVDSGRHRRSGQYGQDQPGAQPTEHGTWIAFGVCGIHVADATYDRTRLQPGQLAYPPWGYPYHHPGAPDEPPVPPDGPPEPTT